MRQVQPHDTVMRLQQRCIYSKVCGRAGQCLHIDTPFCWVQTKQLQCALLAQQLTLVDELIATIVSASAGDKQGVCTLFWSA